MLLKKIQIFSLILLFFQNLHSLPLEAKGNPSQRKESHRRPLTAHSPLRDRLNALPEGRNPHFVGRLTDAQADLMGVSIKVAGEGAAISILKKLGKIPKNLQPSKHWTAGDDITRKGEPGKPHPNYVYTTNEQNQGKFWQYETDEGSRVIALHTNDEVGSHGHVGQPKADSPTRVDFKVPGVRYDPIGGRHHVFYDKPESRGDGK